MTPSGEAITRLERKWVILARLFEELARHGINVDASALRDSKALLHLARTTPSDPCSAPAIELASPLLILEETLEKAQSELISAIPRLGEERAGYWMERISKAELEDSEQSIAYGASRFFPGLPRDRDAGWARLTLGQPIGEGRVQEVAEQFGVLVELEDDLHLILEGKPSMVKKALADIYFLSQFWTMSD